MSTSAVVTGRLYAFLLLALSLALGSTGAASAASLAGVELEESLSLNSDTTLVFSGAGIRKKLFFKLYVGSLYVPEELRGQDAKSIYTADKSMVIKLNILSELLTRDKMVTALETGMRKSTGNNIAPLQAQIDALENSLDDALVPGDELQFSFDASTGITAFIKNGESKAELPGLEFKQALFGIWLSDSPAQASLKTGMVGK